MNKILIVDDSTATLSALKMRIETECPQFEVFTASHPSKALLILETTNFDCILSDFDMPGIDGPAFCRQLKSHKSFADIPFIILTAMDQTNNLLTAIEAGADDFISKDSDLRIIIAKIRAMIRLRDFQAEIAKLRRIEGIKQIIATYNHEFNNPLTIAVGNLSWLKRHCNDPDQMPRIERIDGALNRMGDLIKKIRELRDYVETAYCDHDQLLSLNARKEPAAK